MFNQELGTRHSLSSTLSSTHSNTRSNIRSNTHSNMCSNTRSNTRSSTRSRGTKAGRHHHHILISPCRGLQSPRCMLPQLLPTRLLHHHISMCNLQHSSPGSSSGRDSPSSSPAYSGSSSGTGQGPRYPSSKPQSTSSLVDCLSALPPSQTSVQQLQLLAQLLLPVVLQALWQLHQHSCSRLTRSCSSCGPLLCRQHRLEQQQLI